MSKIEINNIYKIFGNQPDSIMPMVQDGATKDEVLEQTGHTVGLDNVSLNIEEGETFVCMGLSGSGKSTLIRHLNRLIDPTAGEILIDGENVMNFNPEQLIDFRRHKMSMVFQRFGLFPHKTVMQNVGYGLEMQGKSEDERDKIYELYALQMSSAIFGISIVATFILLGWFNLNIITGLIAITFSGFIASILSLVLKLYLYR